MYAIVNDSGRQYKVIEGQSIVVDERAAEVDRDPVRLAMVEGEPDALAGGQRHDGLLTPPGWSGGCIRGVLVLEVERTLGQERDVLAPPDERLELGPPSC